MEEMTVVDVLVVADQVVKESVMHSKKGNVTEETRVALAMEVLYILI